MATVDTRIDDYIERSSEFARPILKHFRELVHQAWPEITETLKWSMPAFEYKGIVCGMASFKNHCAISFWKESLLGSDAFPAEKTAMGSFGRVTSLDDLPPDNVMIGLIQRAVELNEKGLKVKKTLPAKTELVVPDVLTAALKKNAAARKTFENFSYSQKKEYAEWVGGAKTEATRDKRLATALEWLAEGKRKNWKYEKC
jgi:uncharacterized protein YdeI (YjbR/CyaY-like superfamily)